MGDDDKKYAQMQKQLDVLCAALITQAKNINTIIEILERLEEQLFPGIEIPKKINYTDLSGYKQ